MPTNATKNNPAKILDAKAKAKVALQKELGWPAEPKKPLLCIPTALTDDLGGKLFTNIIEGLMSLDVQVLILGKGSSSYGEMASDLAKSKNHLVGIVPDELAAKEAMYEASDMALFLSDPSKLKEVDTCVKNAVVPICPETDRLEKYNAIQESGTAFFYSKIDQWHCFAAIVRAVETHVFPFDWKTIQKHCLEQ